MERLTKGGDPDARGRTRIIGTEQTAPIVASVRWRITYTLPNAVEAYTANPRVNQSLLSGALRSLARALAQVNSRDPDDAEGDRDDQRHAVLHGRHQPLSLNVQRSADDGVSARQARSKNATIG
jgi:hypothetical protein